jgi:hypothetical protein
MLQRCTRQPGLRTAPSRGLASPPALPNWARRFAQPIPLPSRKPLVTLRDAATYITSLPKVEQQAPQWQLAAEMLLLVSARKFHGHALAGKRPA